MKIALIVPSISFDTTVSTPTIRLLADSLGANDGIDLHVFALRYPRSRSQSLESVENLTLHVINGDRMRFRTLMAATVGALRAEHRRGRFDVLHAVWLHEPGTIAALAGGLLRVPVVVSIGGAEVASIPAISYGGALTKRGRLLAAVAMRRAKVVTGGSSYILKLAALTGAGDATLRLVPLPVDADQFQPVPDDRRHCTATRLVHAASLIPVKDQDSLLRAFRIVVDCIPEVRLDIAGEDPFGHRSQLEQVCEELGLSKHVQFLGPIPQADMPSLYQSADLFVLSSYHESQAMVVLEAAACAIPTVGTAVGVVPDLASDAAIVVPPHDHVALAEAVIQLLKQPELRMRMGMAARRRAVSDYDVNPVVEQFTSIYREVAGSDDR